MTVPTSDHTVAQVIHALAVLADKGLLDESSWPAVARILLDQGYRWQAAHDLAATTIPLATSRIERKRFSPRLIR